MPAGPAVAVVVVCHDSAAEVPQTLRALRSQLEPGDEVVVVDNASTDDTPAAVRAADPDAVVVQTGANLGFAGGCHAGAQASGAPLLLFLNPDCTIEPDTVARGDRTAESKPAGVS